MIHNKINFRDFSFRFKLTMDEGERLGSNPSFLLFINFLPCNTGILCVKRLQFHTWIGNKWEKYTNLVLKCSKLKVI